MLMSPYDFPATSTVLARKAAFHGTLTGISLRPTVSVTVPGEALPWRPVTSSPMLARSASRSETGSKISWRASRTASAVVSSPSTAARPRLRTWTGVAGATGGGAIGGAEGGGADASDSNRIALDRAVLSRPKSMEECAAISIGDAVAGGGGAAGAGGAPAATAGASATPGLIGA